MFYTETLTAGKRRKNKYFVSAGCWAPGFIDDAIASRGREGLLPSWDYRHFDTAQAYGNEARRWARACAELRRGPRGDCSVDDQGWPPKHKTYCRPPRPESVPDPQTLSEGWAWDSYLGLDDSSTSPQPWGQGEPCARTAHVEGTTVPPGVRWLDSYNKEGKLPAFGVSHFQIGRSGTKPAGWLLFTVKPMVKPDLAAHQATPRWELVGVLPEQRHRGGMPIRTIAHTVKYHAPAGNSGHGRKCMASRCPQAVHSSFSLQAGCMSR